MIKSDLFFFSKGFAASNKSLGSRDSHKGWMWSRKGHIVGAGSAAAALTRSPARQDTGPAAAPEPPNPGGLRVRVCTNVNLLGAPWPEVGLSGNWVARAGAAVAVGNEDAGGWQAGKGPWQRADESAGPTSNGEREAQDGRDGGEGPDTGGPKPGAGWGRGGRRGAGKREVRSGHSSPQPALRAGEAQPRGKGDPGSAPAAGSEERGESGPASKRQLLLTGTSILWAGSPAAGAPGQPPHPGPVYVHTAAGREKSELPHWSPTNTPSPGLLRTPGSAHWLTTLPVLLAFSLGAFHADQQCVRWSTGPHWRAFPRPSWHGEKGRWGGGARGWRGGAGARRLSPRRRPAAAGGVERRRGMGRSAVPGGCGAALPPLSVAAAGGRRRRSGGPFPPPRAPRRLPGGALRGTSRFLAVSRRPPAGIIPLWEPPQHGRGAFLPTAAMRAAEGHSGLLRIGLRCPSWGPPASAGSAKLCFEPFCRPRPLAGPQSRGARSPAAFRSRARVAELPWRGVGEQALELAVLGAGRRVPAATAPPGCGEHAGQPREPPAPRRLPRSVSPRVTSHLHRGVTPASLLWCPAVFKYLNVIVFGFEGCWESLTAQELLNSPLPFFFFLTTRGFCRFFFSPHISEVNVSPRRSWESEWVQACGDRDLVRLLLV